DIIETARINKLKINKLRRFSCQNLGALSHFLPMPLSRRGGSKGHQDEIFAPGIFERLQASQTATVSPAVGAVWVLGTFLLWGQCWARRTTTVWYRETDRCG